MKELDYHFKIKEENHVVVAFYDRSFKEMVFKFTENEMRQLFKDLKVKIKVHKFGYKKETSHAN